MKLSRKHIGAVAAAAIVAFNVADQSNAYEVGLISGKDPETQSSSTSKKVLGAAFVPAASLLVNILQDSKAGTKFLCQSLAITDKAVCGRAALPGDQGISGQTLAVATGGMIALSFALGAKELIRLPSTAIRSLAGYAQGLQSQSVTPRIS